MATDKWTLIFDTAKCNGCCNCVLATMDEHVDNDFPGYAEAMPRHGHKWFDIECHERGTFPTMDVAYLARMCQHCEDPPCAKPVPGAVRKRSDGVVIIDPVRARGARQIVEACPYGAIHWNEEKQLPQHWNFDAHLLDQGWNSTRANQACPTGALELRKLSDAALANARREEGLEELRPELDSRPRVFYRNLHRVQSVFISGTVLKRVASVVEVAASISVDLVTPEGASSASLKTDAFGDFRFDGLQGGREGKWSVVVHDEKGGRKHVPFELRSSMHLGDIQLEAQ